MITYKQGDIFESRADVLVCPVNCLGTMGAGLALAFKQRYPEVDRSYKVALKHGCLFIGHPYHVLKLDGGHVLLFPTKHDWAKPSSLDFIDSGLAWMRGNCPRNKRYALPALGCGLGELKWVDVRQLIEMRLGDIDLDVEVYEPKGGK